MLLPFTKLTFEYNVFMIEYQDILYSYGKGHIRFYKISKVVENYLLSFLPEHSRIYFKGQLMKIDGNYITPHTDSDRQVTINFYVNTGNAMTLFWDKKENTTDTIQVNGQTNGYVYNTQDLILKHKFVAEPNSVYILDVSKIHSVCMTGKEERLAFCLSSNYYNYNQTFELLKDLIVK